MSMVSLRKSACVIAAGVLIYCCFEQVAFAQSRRNEAVLNRPFSNAGMPRDQGSWVWREKKKPASDDGFEGFVAYVRPNAMNPRDNADITIRLYEAPAAGGDKLVLTETYNFVLDTSNEANNRGSSNKKNETFHFVLQSKQCDAAGKPLTPDCKERLFFLTGTGLRTNNGIRNPNRTFRMTTIIIDRCKSGSSGADDKRKAITPCSDYPDDAVLVEEDYYIVEEYPTTHDEGDTWLDY